MDAIILTRNLKSFGGGVDTILNRAAHLVQGMEGCPIEEIIRSLRVFDKANSPTAKSPNAKRWLKQFAGFESPKSGKVMDPIIEIHVGGKVILSSQEFDDLLKAVDNAAK